MHKYVLLAGEHWLILSKSPPLSPVELMYYTRIWEKNCLKSCYICLAWQAYVLDILIPWKLRCMVQHVRIASWTPNDMVISLVSVLLVPIWFGSLSFVDMIVVSFIIDDDYIQHTHTHIFIYIRGLLLYSWLQLRKFSVSRLPSHHDRDAARRKSSLTRSGFLQKERVSVPLIDKKELSHDVCRFRFGLPTDQTVLGLPVGQHITMYAPNMRGLVGGEWNKKPDPEGGEKEIQRKYTPVTSDDDLGYFDLVRCPELRLWAWKP